MDTRNICRSTTLPYPQYPVMISAVIQSMQSTLLYGQKLKEVLGLFPMYKLILSTTILSTSFESAYWKKTTEVSPVRDDIY
jgi:hypothetical protein